MRPPMISPPSKSMAVSPMIRPPFGMPGMPGMPSLAMLGGPPGGGAPMTDEDREDLDKLQQLRVDKKKMTDAADEADGNGDDGAAKFKRMLAGDIGEQIEELEDKLKAKGISTDAPPPMDVVAMKPPGMPGMPPMPLPPFDPSMGGPMGGMMPGMPPAPFMEFQRMAAMQAAMNSDPDLQAQMQMLQAANQYEMQTTTVVEPELIELGHHFNLDERMVNLLNEQLKKRNNTFDDDIAALYEILRGAKDPRNLLMLSVRQMAEGTFRGTETPDDDVAVVAKKYKLDAPAAMKLAEVMETREDKKGDLKKMAKHLELSNRPSALVMMMLKDLKNGGAVKDPTHAAAVGSYAHAREMKERDKERDKKRRDGEDRNGRRSRSRGERLRDGRLREDNDRRGGDRDRDRDRGRDDRGRRDDRGDRGGGGRDRDDDRRGGKGSKGGGDRRPW